MWRTSQYLFLYNDSDIKKKYPTSNYTKLVITVTFFYHVKKKKKKKQQSHIYREQSN